MKKIELIPNCSELTCRIDLSDKKALEKEGLEVEEVELEDMDPEDEDKKKTIKGLSIHDPEYDVTLESSSDPDDPSEQVIMISDCDDEFFPTLEKIVAATGNDVQPYDGGHTSSFEDFANNKVEKLKLTTEQTKKLKYLLTTDTMLDTENINGKVFGRYLKAKKGDLIYFPKEEAKILEKHLKSLFPGKKKEELLGESFSDDYYDE